MTDDQAQLEAKLADYVDGNLSPAETREVEAYLDAHPEIRTMITRLMLDSEALQSLPTASAPVDFSEDFRGQVERDMLLGAAEGPGSHRRRFSFPVAAIAAVFVAGLGASLVWLLVAQRPSPFDVAIHVPTENTPTEKPSVESAPTVIESEPTIADASEAVRSDGPPGRATLSRDGLMSVRLPDLPVAGASAPPSEPTIAAIPAPMLTKVEAVPLTEEIDGLIGDRRLANRRSVVFVVDAPTHEVADRLDERVAGLIPATETDGIEHRAAEPHEAIANHGDTRNGYVPDHARYQDAAARSRIMDNVMRPSATGQAIASLDAEAAIHVSRGLTELEAVRLQTTLFKLTGTSAAVHSYEAPPIEESLFIPVEQKEKDEVPATQPTDDQSAVSSATQPALRAGVVATTQPMQDLLRRGERLRITLVDPDASNLTSRHEVTIDLDTGDIELPQLEHVPAADVPASRLAEQIVQRYAEAGLIPNAQVTVESLDVARLRAVASKKFDAHPQLIQGLAIPGAAQMEPELAERVDVFVVVRGLVREPATQPTTAPAEESMSPPTTQPLLTP